MTSFGVSIVNTEHIRQIFLVFLLLTLRLVCLLWYYIFKPSYPNPDTYQKTQVGDLSSWYKVFFFSCNFALPLKML